MDDAEPFHAARVKELLSAPRLAPYLRSVGEDLAEGLTLYVWSAQVASSAFELIGHFEVLLRNALDAQLSCYMQEAARGIPWVLLPMPSGDRGHIESLVAQARERLRAQGKEARHQIIAQLGFGFWSGLLGKKHEQLWRTCLRHAFPYSSGNRKDVAVAVDGIRKFRNRIAHHDSMVNVDVPFEVRRLLHVAGYIDPEAARWLDHISRAMDVYAEKPVVTADTAVVAARRAWTLYRDCQVYVCQAGRSFRPVQRLAFYTDREVKADIPAILHRRDNVEWSEDHAARLLTSDGGFDRKIGTAIRKSQIHGWTGGLYQVFVLTGPGHPSHRQLAGALPHAVEGRGTAFTQRQRYVSLHQLELARDTSDLA